MFSGIVTGIGRVVSMERRAGGFRIAIAPPAGWGSLAAGESVAVSGVCLTAARRGRELVADLSSETVRRTALSRLRPGDRVNLERALCWGDRLSGHFVLGHVDGIVRILAVERAGNSWLYRFSLPAALSRFVAEKGSVALEGVSLTVARRESRRFEVAVVPATRRATTLGEKGVGDAVHFEADVFARYGRSGWRRRVRPLRR